VRYFFPRSYERQADMHQLVCQLTYWSKNDSIGPACDYAIELSVAAAKAFPQIAKPLRLLLREKLLALTYREEITLTPAERLILGRTLMRKPLCVGWRQWWNDMLGCRLNIKQIRSTREA
jgi:hypothetical protein